MNEQIEKAEIVNEEQLQETEQQKEKQLTEQQKEMLQLMNLMNNPDKADELIRDKERFKHFKKTFGNFDVKKCRRKSCERLHLKVKGIDFCSEECKSKYYK
jgi:hypothetical protein